MKMSRTFKQKIMNPYLTYFNKTILSDDCTQYVLRIFGVMIWASVTSTDVKWFRLFGKGLLFNSKTKRRFSVRNGLSKSINIGKYDIEYLP